MNRDYSPNESPFGNPPETSQCSTDINNASNPRIISKTKIVTTKSYLDGEKIKERRNYNLYQSGHGRTEKNITNEYYEENEKNPFEIVRNKPQNEENYEVYENYEKFGKNDNCGNYDYNYDDYENCQDCGKCKEQRGCTFCNFYECKYCQNKMDSLYYDQNCAKNRSPRDCRNYDLEYYRCKNYEDNKGYDDNEKCPECKKCLCCTYDCEYCRNLIESEDFRKKNGFEDRDNCEYFRNFKYNTNRGERCKSFKDYDNFRNTQEEEYEKCTKYKGNEKSYDNWDRNKRSIYSNNYECNYCQDKKSKSKSKSKSKEDISDWENGEGNNSCNEYYRKCIVKRHGSYNPTQILYKKNKKKIR